ncbi:MAG: lipopolysaccharide heptosyltransferase II, partial [Phycisphaerae bacterium]
PVARALRQAWPEAHIAWLVSGAFAGLLEAEPAVDEVIRFDRRYYARVFRSATVTRDFFGFVGALRRRRFDLVIDLQGLFRSGFLAWASGAGVRIGFRDSREFAWLFNTHQLRTRRAQAHALDRNLEALSLLGIDAGRPDARPAYTPEDEQSVRAALAEHGINAEDGYAVLVPSARWETKQWPADRFGTLAAGILKAWGFRGLLVGGRDDHETAEAARQASDGAAINLCGRTTLRQLAVLIAAARVVVTADSSPMHMAAAFRRPLVALFGPTSPARTGPYGMPDAVLRLDLACSPCYLRKRRDCPFELKCLHDLSVERVLAAVSAALSGTDPIAVPRVGCQESQ